MKMWLLISRLRFLLLLDIVVAVSFTTSPTRSVGFVAPSFLCSSAPRASRQLTRTAMLTRRFVKSKPQKKLNADVEDLERARREFERLLQTSQSNSNAAPSENDCDDDVGVLSCACRQRRLLEMELLESLRTSDDAIDELMHLWIHECPADIHAVDAIQVLEQDCHPDNAEVVLQQIVQLHPEWPEPHSRLALLWFVQGRYEECERAVQTVLQQKPWHFEALQMQVLLKLVIHNPNYLASAVQCARRGLPPLNQPKRRQQWVDWAVLQAQRQLVVLEERADRARAAVGESSTEEDRLSASVWQ